MKRVILVIGGPGFGKTTLVKELERLGFNAKYDPCTKEFFLKLDKERPELNTHSHDFNRIVFQERVRQYGEAQGICFFDRGIPDGLAYMENASEEFWQLARDHPYGQIAFVTPPWENIFVRHIGRRENIEEAREVHKKIVKVYKQLGYKLIELPKVDARKRAQFVLEKLKLKAPEGISSV